MRQFEKFLCRCAGVNLELIVQYPIEISKYCSVGATVLFTGIFATLSGGYAIFKIFDSYFAAVFLGIIWGLLIFNLDRFIVMSLKKRENKRKELVMAIPRIILALIISVVVAKPLEVRIFSDRIASVISDQELQQQIDNRDRLSQIYQIGEVKSDLGILDTLIVNSTKQLNELPKTVQYRNLIAQQKQLKVDLANAISQKNQAQQKISQFFNQYTYSEMTDGQLVQKRATKRQHLPSGAWSRIASTVKKRDNLRDLIPQIEQQQRDVEVGIAQEILNYQNSIETKLSDLNVSRSIQDSVVKSRTSQWGQGSAATDSIAKRSFSENFVSQLEALGKLTKYQSTEKDEEGNVVKEPDNTMFWINIAIMLLFIVIETAPVFVKIIAPKGLYDEALEKKFEMDQSLIIGKSNQAIMNDIHNEESLVETIEKIKNYKQEVLTKYLDIWKEQELARVKKVKKAKKPKKILAAIKRILKFDLNVNKLFVK